MPLNPNTNRPPLPPLLPNPGPRLPTQPDPVLPQTDPAPALSTNQPAAPTNMPLPALPPPAETLFFKICEKKGHAARNCWHRYHARSRYVDPPPFQAYVAQPVTSPAPHEWCIDSGATHHVISDMNNLSSYVVYEGADTL